MIENNIGIMKKNIEFFSSFIIFVSLIIGNNLQAQEKNELLDLDNYISTVFKKLQTGTMPGASVLVAQNGEIIYQKGFGYAILKRKFQLRLI